MTIRGGGFGPKKTGPGRPAVSTRASDKRKASSETQTQASAEINTDSFETGGLRAASFEPVSPTAGAESLAELQELIGGASDRVSQLKDVLGAFEQNNQRLRAQFEGLQNKAHSVVQDLASKGFDATSLKSSRPVLDELRGQMRKVKHRLLWVNRRIKTLQSQAHGTPLFDAATLQRKTSKLASHGISRGLGLIAMGGDVLPQALDGHQGIGRLSLGAGGAIDRHALGSYVSQIAPQTMLSRFAVNLIQAGRSLRVAAPVSEELRGLHDDVQRGRAGKGLEAIAQISSAAE